METLIKVYNFIIDEENIRYVLKENVKPVLRYKPSIVLPKTSCMPCCTVYFESINVRGTKGFRADLFFTD